MLKRFLVFREKLTYKQLNRILLVVGIIFVPMCVLSESEEQFAARCMLGVCILFLIWLFLGGIDKEIIRENKECERRLNEKFKGNEETEVYFMPSEISGDVVEFFKAPYEIFGLTYLAHKEGDKFVVRLMQGEKELRNDEIENSCFFEDNFKFPEIEEKE